MRHSVYSFMEAFSTIINTSGVIVEMGSFQVEGQEEISNIKHLFNNYNNYYACDMRPGSGVDKIENVQFMSFDDESIDVFIMMDVLEHVQDPFTAMKEVHRVLKNNGVVVISSVMDFPIHAHPDDYWRYTPSGFKELCREFDNVVIFSEGYQRQPETVIAIASKNKSLNGEISENILTIYKKIKRSPMPRIKLLAKEVLWGIRRYRNRNNIIIN